MLLVTSSTPETSSAQSAAARFSRREFTVPVRLFRDVTAQLKVHVVKQDA